MVRDNRTDALTKHFTEQRLAVSQKKHIPTDAREAELFGLDVLEPIARYLRDGQRKSRSESRTAHVIALAVGQAIATALETLTDGQANEKIVTVFMDEVRDTVQRTLTDGERTNYAEPR
jgi:hypothetical protein